MQESRDFHLPGNFSILIREYLVPAVVIVLLLVGVAAAMATEINILAATIEVFGAALISLAIVSPRIGMYLLILAAGYLDLVKRLMVVTGQVAMSDVTWVLAVAPVLFAAIVVGVIGHRIFRHRIIEKGEGVIISLIAVLMTVNLYLVYRDTTSVSQTLQGGANTAGYIPLLFLTGILFPKATQIARFLRYIPLVLLPVPLYALWQLAFGYAGFEYDYLRSGLTVTEMYLGDVVERPFSTLASAHPLTVACAILFLLCLIPIRLDRSRSLPFTNAYWFVPAVIYLGGCFASLARSGWVAAAVGLIAVLCFWNRTLTKAFYSIGISLFLLMVLNPYWIEAHLGDMAEMLPSGSDTAEMAFRLGTIGDRLHGWKNMIANPLAFGPFGIPVAERTEEVYVHDQIGDIMVNTGYIGLIAILTIVTFAIVRAHKLTWKVRDPEARQIAIICMAAIFGVLSSGAMFGGHTSVYPVNLLFWILAGVVFRIVSSNQGPGDAIKKSDEPFAGKEPGRIVSGPFGQRLTGIDSPAYPR